MENEIIERENYRKIAEKYRSAKNDKYRKKSRNNYFRKKEIADKNIKFPFRIMTSFVIFISFAIFTYIGGENGEKIEEKVKDILEENIGIESFEDIQNYFTKIGENTKVDKEILEEMEEDTYNPAYP